MKKMVKKKYKLKGWMLGGVMGLVWGLLSSFIGVWFIREGTNLIFLPLLIAYEISEYFKFMAPIRDLFLTIIPIIIGLLIGALVGFIISKIINILKK